MNIYETALCSYDRTPCSYDLPDMFADYIVNNDLKSALNLLEECFEMFPKEKESLTRIILQELLESAELERHKIFIKYLLKQLDINFSNWNRDALI